MGQHRQVFESDLLTGVSGDDRALIDVNPTISHIENEVKSMLITFPDLSVVLSATAINSGQPSDTDHSEILWQLLRLIMNQFLDMEMSSTLTVSIVAQSLLDKDQVARPASLPPDDLVIVVEQLVAAVLGWVTSLFNWRFSTRRDHCSVAGGPCPDKLYMLHMEYCNRITGVFMRHFGIMPQEYSDEPRMEDLLYLSLLNFHSLTHIGGIAIRWTPLLSQHLSLELETRTLCLFKYPSLCVLALLDGDYGSLYRRVTHDLYQDSRLSLHREVLLSLRYILGATRKSRRLAKRLISNCELKENLDSSLGKLLDGKLDHLLTHPSSNVPTEALINQAYLTPWNDFPLLGHRLLQIRKYNEQQRPTTTWSMIRDKRNPAQWWTLWAVLLIGGLSVILSTLQLAVSIAQLRYSI